MTAQGIPVHQEDKFTAATIAGTTYLVTEASSLAQEGVPAGLWASFSTVGLIPGQSRFRLRHAATDTASEFVFRRQVTTEVGKRCEFSGPGGWRALVYL